LLSGNLRNGIDIFKIRHALSRLDNGTVASQMAMLETQDSFRSDGTSCIHLSLARPGSSAAAS
jgi:hypothetical protein